MASVSIHEIYVRQGGERATRLKVLVETPEGQFHVYVFMTPAETYEIVPLSRKHVRRQHGMLSVVSEQPLRRTKDLEKIPATVKVAVQRYKGRPYELRAFHAR